MIDRYNTEQTLALDDGDVQQKALSSTEYDLGPMLCVKISHLVVHSIDRNLIDIRGTADQSTLNFVSSGVRVRHL